jgi:hypothetical protein
MSLVRRGGKTYLYRSVRRGGRVTSRYMAGGAVAELLDAQARRARALRRAGPSEDPGERRRLDELDRALDALVAEARGLAHAVLTEAGFHQHKRQWRKRRGERS